jgi:hypothetical protein
MTSNFFSPLSFVAVFGSGIRDPRSGIRDLGWVKFRIQDPGSGINIPDPQHCVQCIYKPQRHKNVHRWTIRVEGKEIKAAMHVHVKQWKTLPFS